MGRKGDFQEKIKKGPGKKSKKQPAPTLSIGQNNAGDDGGGDIKKLSKRQKQRKMKRDEKAKAKEVAKAGKSARASKGFSDDNKEWLKPKVNGRACYALYAPQLKHFVRRAAPDSHYCLSRRP